jgi:hypothetical protein
MRALAHLRYRDPDESNTSREAIVVARPDRLRVEVLSMFGSVFLLTADDGMMSAYARQERTVYRGRASAENLWHYGRVALPVGEVIDILLATPPPRSGAARVTFDRAAESVALWRDLEHGAQVVWFSDAGLPAAAEERDHTGQPLWRATFGGYEQRSGAAIATRIGLEFPAAQRTLEITLENVDVNPLLERSLFAFQTPPGTRIVDLDRVAD